MKKPEFSIGQSVTFKPYEKALPAKVMRIQRGINGTGVHINGEPDNRVFYELSGPCVLTITSGTSIVESALFEESHNE